MKPPPCRCDRYAFPHRETDDCRERDTGDDWAELKAADDAARARDMNKEARR